MGYNNHTGYKKDRHEKREKITSCPRCNGELTRFGYSAFDASIICEECKKLETQHPDYERAVERNKEEILAGNYSFKGIGKPENL